MANLKKILKIKEGLDSAYNKFKESVETDDEKIILKYLREFSTYMIKHRKVLQLSDEEVHKINETLNDYEKLVTEVEIKEAEAAESHRKYKETKEGYFEALLQFPPSGKKRTNH